MWTILFTNNAKKDKKKLKEAGLDNKVKSLLNIMSVSPFTTPPSYEKLVGDLIGYYSRRINVQHRLVYRVEENDCTIFVHSMWTHYEK